MGTEYETETYGQLLAAPHPTMALWAAETTATEADPYAGELVAVQATRMTWRPSGAPETGAAFGLKTLRAGYAGSAEIGYTDASTARTYGWDPPTSVSYVETVRRNAGDATLSLSRPTIAALSTGGCLAVSEDRPTAGGAPWTRDIDVRYRAPDGVWSATVLTLVTTESYTASHGLDPCVVSMGNGFVRIYHFQLDPDSLVTQVVAWEADEDDDLTDIASWSIVSTDCLGAGIDVSTNVVSWLRVAVGGGQVMLIIQQAGDTILQYASRDGGNTFSSVGSLTDSEAATICRVGGYFVVCNVKGSGTAYLYSRRVADAFSPLSSVTPITLDTLSGAPLPDQLSLVADPAGVGWLYVSEGSATLASSQAWQTDDEGATWWTPYGIAQSSYPARSWCDRSPGGMNCCWWRDRVLMIHGAETDAIYAASLTVTHLGGWTDVTMPWSGRGTRQIDRVGWYKTWLPIEVLTTSFTLVSAGAPTAVSSTGPAYVVTCAPGDSYSLQSTTTEVLEVGARYVIDVDAGAVDLQLQYTDATNAWRVRVTQSTTQLDVYDDIAGGAALHTLAATGAQEVRIHVLRDRYIVYSRAWAAGARVWNIVGSGSSLTSAASANATYACTVNASSTASIYCLSTSITGSYLDTMGHGMLGLEWAGIPIHGRPITTAPIYIADGVSVEAASGPTVVGDTWTYSTDYEHSIEQIEITSTYPSRFQEWRSVTAASMIVAWKLAEAAADTLQPVWAVYHDGSVHDLKIAWHDGATWGSYTTIAGYWAITATRKGDSLVPSSASANTSGVFVQEDELVGGLAYNAAVPSKTRKIIGNTAGVIQASSSKTWRIAVLTLEGIDGTESSSSVTWNIAPPRILALVVPPTTAKGVRIQMGATLTSTVEGYFRGKLAVWPCHVLGYEPSRTHVARWTAPMERSAYRNGSSWSSQPARARRIHEVSWADAADRLKQVRTDTADPDWIAGVTASTPGYSRGEAESTIGAMVMRHAASGQPVLYVPKYTRASWVGAQMLLARRAGGSVCGTVEPEWTVEHVDQGGHEYDDDTVRLGGIQITEVVGPVDE